MLPEPKLSPAAVALLNLIAEATTPVQGAADPWASFPPVMGIADVARAMGRTTAAAREAARRHRIPMVKRLGRYVIDQAVFRDWLRHDHDPVEMRRRRP